VATLRGAFSLAEILPCVALSVSFGASSSAITTLMIALCSPRSARSACLGLYVMAAETFLG
jgi:hypothetical protein